MVENLPIFKRAWGGVGSISSNAKCKFNPQNIHDFIEYVIQIGENLKLFSIII